MEEKELLIIIQNKNEIYISEYNNQETEDHTQNHVEFVESIHSETGELKSGIPHPERYDQYLINKYSFPKGLICGRKAHIERNKKDDRKLLVHPPFKRKGIVGWKLSSK